MSKRTIEIDDATATALELRAAEVGLSVPELLAEMIGVQGARAELSDSEVTDLDRQWAAIKAGESTVPHDDVVR
jgi:hypothetical protein